MFVCHLWQGKSEKGHDRDWGPPVNGAKTVAEVEAEMAKGKIERVKRNADSGGKQPVEAKGTHCQVHKHSGMGSWAHLTTRCRVFVVFPFAWFWVPLPYTW